MPKNSSPTSKSTDLPLIGNGIDYGLVPKDVIEKFNTLRGHVQTLRDNYDILQRIQSGQIGPEITSLLGEYAPRSLRKPIKDGRLSLDVNYQQPYIGFTYRF